MPSPSHYDRLASAIESVKASDPHWRNPERAVRSTLLILLLSPGGVRPSTMSGATVLAALEKVGLATEDKKAYRYTKTPAAQKFGIAKDFTQKEREEAADELGDSPGHAGGKRAAPRLSRAETTKKGAHGTLHLYVIRYYDTSERGNAWTTRKWAYDEEHARQKFYDGDSDGWAIESVKRA